MSFCSAHISTDHKQKKLNDYFGTLKISRFDNYDMSECCFYECVF